MFRKTLKKLAIFKRKEEPVVFFDLSSKEKKKVIKKAIHLANKEQKDLMQEVAKKDWNLAYKNCP